MSLGLNSLTGNTSNGIEVNKFIKKITSANQKEKLTYTDKLKLIKDTNIGNKTKSPLLKEADDLNKKLKASANSLINSQEMKNRVNDLLESTLGTDAESLENCLKHPKSVTAKSAIKSTVSNLNKTLNKNPVIRDVKTITGRYIKKPEKLINDSIDSTLSKATSELKSGLLSSLAKLDNCNGINNKNALKGIVSNSLLSAFASNIASTLDCTNGLGIDFLGCTSTGKFKGIGITQGLATKIMRDSASKLHLDNRVLNKVISNKEFKKLVSKTFNKELTIKTVYNNKTKSDSEYDMGSKLADIYGSNSISDIKKTANIKKKKDQFFLAGAIKKVLEAV